MHNYSAGNTIQTASFMNGVFIFTVNRSFPTDQDQAPKTPGIQTAGLIDCKPQTIF